MCATLSEYPLHVTPEVIVCTVGFVSYIAQDDNSESVWFETGVCCLESVFKNRYKFLIRSLVGCVIGQVRISFKVIGGQLISRSWLSGSKWLATF